MVVALLLAACSQGGHKAAPAGDRPLTVGSFAFTESSVVAELYAQSLETDGIAVRRAPGLGSREQVEPALEQGAVDIVPEYVGTALRFLDESAEANIDLSNADAAYRRLQAAFAPRGITVLTPAAAQDRNGIAVTKATAGRLRLAKVSDLAPVASGMVLGGPPECPERPFCLIGLRAVYGLTFKAFRPLDASGPDTVAALEGAEVDVAVLFTTAPALATKDFVLLDDDRHLQPAENLVPAVRTEALGRYGGRVRPALDAVSRDLRTEDLIALNRQVDDDHRAPGDVAREWLASHGLRPR